MGDYDLYRLNQQKAFGARYIARNFPISQKYQKYNKNNIKYKDNTLIKNKQDVRLPNISN